MTLGSRIATAREAKGLTQAQLAKPLGVTTSAVGQWETDKAQPSSQRLPAIARLLGVSVEWLMLDDAVRMEEAQPAFFPPATPSALRDVPVLGATAAGDDGEFAINEGVAIDLVLRPPRLANIPDAYALLVWGDSMSPWREQGSLVYLTPSHPPKPDDYVVIHLAPEHGEAPHAFLKRLVRRTEKEVRVRQYNPPKELTFPRAKVAAIHRVMDWPEMIGI